MGNFDLQCAEQYQKVYRFILKLSRDARVAEEITQETFVKALRGYGGFHGKCSLYTWLCQIAKNTYFNYLKKEKSIMQTEVLPNMIAAHTPEEAYLKKEKLFSIHKALHRMSEPYKEVLTLRVFGELEYAQIAALFEKREGWARVTFYRAKEMLRTEMEGEHDE